MSVLKLPPLYAVDAEEKIRKWEIAAFLDGNEAVMRRTHGLIDGKRQINLKPLKGGKNIGRSNETTPFEQACSEIRSMWLKMQDQGYVDYIPDPNNPPDFWLPMKAKGYRQRKAKVVFPCYVQPKLNGVRTMVEPITADTVLFHTGGNKTYDILQHLEKALFEYITMSDQPDAEVYKHGWPLNRITSYVKKRYNFTKKLQLWIFDWIINGMPFEERWETVISKIPAKHKLLIRVPTIRVKSHAEIERYNKIWLKEGYEGTMVRMRNGLYRKNYRSPHVLKYPEYLRKEFKIIGVKEGEGLDKGCAVFICLSKGGPVDVRPQGTVKKRQGYLKDFANIKGKSLTVKFKEMSTYGIPLCPTGEAIRDYE